MCETNGGNIGATPFFLSELPIFDMQSASERTTQR
jgi:hypothetical protein